MSTHDQHELRRSVIGAGKHQAHGAHNIEDMKPVDCLRLAKSHIKAGKHKDAFIVLQKSVMHYPNEPVLLSYYGCYLAVTDKKYRMGIETCQKAFEKVKLKNAYDEQVLFPLFYCNLGKAYAAAGKRKEAIDAMQKGLTYDRGNSDILRELRTMGMRTKKPPFSFLDRNNPLNKYLSIMLYRKAGSPKKEAER
jgi:tetratricopeptide (TPR) repeat protein